MDTGIPMNRERQNEDNPNSRSRTYCIANQERGLFRKVVRKFLYLIYLSPKFNVYPAPSWREATKLPYDNSTLRPGVNWYLVPAPTCVNQLEKPNLSSTLFDMF